ncbi:MAG: hypothetical protein WDA16_05220 [Candidatus Thermoplasmatota archaeon]
MEDNNYEEAGNANTDKKSETEPETESQGYDENKSQPNKSDAASPDAAEKKPELTGAAADASKRAKGKVQRGIATVAGSLKGFAEGAEKSDLAKTTGAAIGKAGEAIRKVGGAATQEFQKTKEHFAKGGAAAEKPSSYGYSTSAPKMGEEEDEDASKKDAAAAKDSSSSDDSGSSSSATDKSGY